MEMNEELNAMQEVAEAATEESWELNAEELSQVAGGNSHDRQNAKYDIFFLCPTRHCPNSWRGCWWYNAPVPNDSDMPACSECGTRMYIQRKLRIS